jgi:hypothetical protein
MQVDDDVMRDLRLLLGDDVAMRIVSSFDELMRLTVALSFVLANTRQGSDVMAALGGVMGEDLSPVTLRH